MNLVLKIISYTGLGLTVIPSILVLTGVITFASHKHLMIAGAVLWFATAPFWINKKKTSNNAVDQSS